MGRLGEIPEGSEVVAPGSSPDPFTQPASPSASAGPSPGAPADQGGEGRSAAINPADLPPARPVLEPPPPAAAGGAPAQAPAPTQAPAQATAAPATAPAAAPAQQPAPAQAQAPAQPATAQVPPGATAPPPAPVAQEPAPVQPTADEIRAEERKLADERVAAVQSGTDKRLNEVTAQQEQLTKQLEESRQQSRDLILHGIPEAERPAKLAEWELEDKTREVDALRTDAVNYGTDVELASLLLEFQDVPGVTEEALRPVPVDDRDVWCMTKQNEYLREQLDAAQNGDGKPPATAAAPAQVPATVPAGAQAPSDAAGGAGTPPPPGQPVRNEEQNREAMTDNMRSGWETVDFGRPR